MAKLTLTDLSSLSNETSVINTINNNNTAIETALENTLSRDGTVPNVMEAGFDMNSNRILNLPNATDLQEPVTLYQLNTTAFGTSTIAISTVTGLQAALDAKVPTTRTITAAGALTGGGDLSSNRTITLDITALTALTSGLDTSNDYVLLYDASAAAYKKINPSNLVGPLSSGVSSFNGRSGSVSPASADYTAAQVTNTPAGNIAATTVQTALNELDTEKVATTRNIAVSGALTGGGTLAADRTITLDVNGLTEDTAPSRANDFILTYDASAGSHKKAKLNSFFKPTSYVYSTWTYSSAVPYVELLVPTPVTDFHKLNISYGGISPSANSSNTIFRTSLYNGASEVLQGTDSDGTRDPQTTDRYFGDTDFYIGADRCMFISRYYIYDNSGGGAEYYSGQRSMSGNTFDRIRCYFDSGNIASGFIALSVFPKA
jgi:hypothetical protein